MSGSGGCCFFCSDELRRASFSDKPKACLMTNLGCATFQHRLGSNDIGRTCLMDSSLEQQKETEHIPEHQYQERWNHINHVRADRRL